MSFFPVGDGQWLLFKEAPSYEWALVIDNIIFFCRAWRLGVSRPTSDWLKYRISKHQRDVHDPINHGGGAQRG